MSAPLPFCFVLHLHQPVGNFDHVFRDHADDVYAPFLSFLEERDLWPIGLHVSGPLLEWMEAHDRALHDRIGRHAADGRIELLSAGWYEPVLASLPRVDRAEQLGWMREELRTRFGVDSRGSWLTERAWQPDLAGDLADAGIEYVLVDDHLARRAGAAEEDLARPLRTEADGRTLDLLCIDERLRYLIPFRPAEAIEEDLRARHERGAPMALFGDDGEKFGGWPRTREWLYEGGWLEAFGDRMDALRRDGVVRWLSPGEAHARVDGAGPVYLPSGSYPEMEEWAPGGHWNGFLTRYAEANRMHKRMLALSRLTRERGDPPAARRAVARAQCNDAYWHGVFGGLYMKHLREGVRRQLLRAEAQLRKDTGFGCTRSDVDGDGHEEWWVHGPAVSAWVRADGSVSDLLWLEAGVDVLDVLTRYREQYHEEALRRGPAEDAGERSDAPSIHEIEETATLDRLPPVDRETRVLVRDRVLGVDVDLDAYAAGDAPALWTGESYRGGDPDAAGEEGGERLRWTFRTVSGPEVMRTLDVHSDGTVEYGWSWRPEDFPADARFCPEVSLGTPVHLVAEPDVELWRWPIVTTSKCPDGFEEIEQGTSVTPLWPIELGRARLVLRPPG